MIAYDVKDDAVRRRVVKILKNYGTRVQYSVFECYLSRPDKHDLQKQLTALLTSEDRLRFYPLCQWCREKIEIQGRGKVEENVPFYLF